MGGAFLTASGARKADSTVKYTRVAPKSGGRRLAEGTSVANWVLYFDKDDQATTAAAKVSSAKFTEAVAKASGVKVEAAKATVEVVAVKVTEKVVGSGRGKGSGGKPAGSASGLQILSDKACITLGAKGDTSICRVGPNEVEISGDVIINGRSIKKFMERLENFMKQVGKK